MIRIALVGSIGSGKSHIAKLFKFLAEFNSNENS